MEDCLAKDPETDAISVADNDMTMSMLQAISTANRQGEMLEMDLARLMDIAKRIMDGNTQLPMDVTYTPALILAAVEMKALRFVRRRR